MFLSRLIAKGAFLLGMLLTTLGLAGIYADDWQALAAAYLPGVEFRLTLVGASPTDPLDPPEMAPPPGPDVRPEGVASGAENHLRAGGAAGEATRMAQATGLQPESQVVEDKAGEPAPSQVAEQATPAEQAATIEGPPAEGAAAAEGEEPDLDAHARDEIDLPVEPPPTPARLQQTPVKLVIPRISLEAPVVPAETSWVKERNREFQQWQAPDEFAAGWHDTSARLGEPGNTVLNGHNNIHGEVFVDLDQLKVHDLIWVFGEHSRYLYEVTNTLLVRERYADWDERMENARWILTSPDERLTLVTCWPYKSNTHRVIVVAVPVLVEDLAQPDELELALP